MNGKVAISHEIEAAVILKAQRRISFARRGLRRGLEILRCAQNDVPADFAALLEAWPGGHFLPAAVRYIVRDGSERTGWPPADCRGPPHRPSGRHRREESPGSAGRGDG